MSNPEVQTVLQPLCLQYNVQAVFAGHNHFYAHCVIDNVHHLTTGGGGATLYTAAGKGKGLILSETTLHYIHASVQPDSVIFSAIRTDGTIIESFSISEIPWPEPEPPAPGIKKMKQIEVYLTQPSRILTVEKSDSKNATLEIVNVSGRVVHKRKITTHRTVIDLAPFQKGVYFIRVVKGNPIIPTKITLY
jgi:hypothetical protein